MKSKVKKTLILVLAMVVVIGLMVGMTMLVKEKTVAASRMTITSLNDLYDDDTRAKEDIAAMQDAGILDANGKMVDLDLRENGESVSLAALTTRIANGETVGNITVNGKETTPEQVMKISQVSAALEIAELLDTEIDVTDAHVKNLEALLTGIQNGTIDVQSTLKTGELRLSPNSSGNVALRGTTTGSGTVDATNGSYTAPYISDSTYDASYAFDLADPTNTAWYTESPAVSSGGGSGNNTPMAYPRFTDFTTGSSSQNVLTFAWYRLKTNGSSEDQIQLTENSSYNYDWWVKCPASNFYYKNDSRQGVTSEVASGKIQGIGPYDARLLNMRKTSQWNGSQCVFVRFSVPTGATFIFDNGRTEKFIVGEYKQTDDV
ncbi:MAG: hypothetical protein IK037_01090, partial [Clostridia bacterium]|nr:hypothetical protein [Clostridia bacterium]